MEQPPTEGPGAEFLRMIEDRVSTGIDPLYVAELVREGIEQDWPYIFTDNEFEPLIDERRNQAGLRPHPRPRTAALMSKSGLSLPNSDGCGTPWLEAS